MEIKSTKIRRRMITFGFKTVATAILVGLVILMSLCVGERPTGFFGTVASIGFYISLLLAAAWFFFIFSELLRRPYVKLLFFAVLFVWGSVSYFLWPVDCKSGRTDPPCAEKTVHVPTVIERQIEAPNRTLAAFFPSRGGFEDLGDRARCHYFAFHLMVVFFVAAVGFSIFGRGLVNRFRRFLSKPEQLNVFWGYSTADLMLAKDIIATSHERQAIVMLPEDLRFDKEKFARITHHLDEHDIIWICRDDDNFDPLYLRGRHHYFLSASGHENLVLANRLAEYKMEKKYRTPDDTHLYVRVESNEEERLFYDWADRVKDFVKPVIVREPEIVARNFIRNHPMLECPGLVVDPLTAHVTGNIRLLLIGFGSHGRTLLREMVCGGQFTGIDSFGVDIIESDLSVRESFALEYAEAMKMLGIRFMGGIEAEGPGFERFMRENLRNYSRIVVCLKGDDMNIRVAMSIMKMIDAANMGPRPGVLFARVSNPDRYDYFKPDGRLTVFGNISEIYHFGSLDIDPIDSMAMVLNAEWAQDETPEEAWEKASIADRQSSRASAQGARWHAQALGLDIVPADDPRPVLTEDEFRARLAHGREETIARNEHLRWNAYHWLLGYSRWDMDTPRLEDLPANRMKTNQLKFFGRHAALVPFDELSDVDYRIACALNPENRSRLKRDDFVGDKNVDILGDGKHKASLQAYDIRFVRKIYANAQAAGMKLVRRDAV